MKNQEDFIICRCENIHMSEIKEILQQGADNARELKLKSRAGMGFCASRTCGPFIETLTQDHEETPTYINLKSQPPIRTISMADFIKEDFHD